MENVSDAKNRWEGKPRLVACLKWLQHFKNVNILQSEMQWITITEHILQYNLSEIYHLLNNQYPKFRPFCRLLKYVQSLNPLNKYDLKTQQMSVFCNYVILGKWWAIFLVGSCQKKLNGSQLSPIKDTKNSFVSWETSRVNLDHFVKTFSFWQRIELVYWIGLKALKNWVKWLTASND